MKNIIEKKKQEQQNPSTKENEYSDAQMNIAISSSQAKLCIVFALLNFKSHSLRLTDYFFKISSKLTVTMSNCWMRLSMISWYHSLSCTTDNTGTRFDNSWYHAKTKFINCSIIHFSNDLQKMILLSEFAKVWKNHMREGLGSQADFELDTIFSSHII